jgi:hypothetical protein
MQEDRLSLSFFSFAPDAAYSRASDGSNNKNQLFTYFPMWKCANNQLHGFWEDVFGKPKQTWRQLTSTYQSGRMHRDGRSRSHFSFSFGLQRNRIPYFKILPMAREHRQNVALWPFQSWFERTVSTTHYRYFGLPHAGEALQRHRICYLSQNIGTAALVFDDWHLEVAGVVQHEYQFALFAKFGGLAAFLAAIHGGELPWKLFECISDTDFDH